MHTTVTPKQENNKLKSLWKKPWLVVVLIVVLLGGGFIVFRALASRDQSSTTLL